MLLGFKKRFANPILIGTKVLTMRNRRKREAKIGETLHMYTGLRTANCELITNKEKLISKQTCWVRIRYYNKKLRALKICVDGRALTKEEIDEFVKWDGFLDVEDFFQFWISGYQSMKDSFCQITKVLIIHHWTDLKI